MRLIIYLLVFVLLVAFGIWSGMSSATFALILATLAAIEIIAGWIMFFVKRWH